MGIKITKIMEMELSEDGITRYSVPCSKCLYALPPLEELAEVYFEDERAICSKCGENNDIWQSTLQAVRSYPNEDSFFDFVGLGAKSTTFVFELWRGQMIEINFIDYGVPASAVILDASFTGNSDGEPSCLPQEIRVPFGKRFYASKVKVYGMPLSTGNKPIRVWANVRWVYGENNAEPWLLLADAFEALAAFQYSRVLSPAHSAFEISLSRLIKKMLSSYATNESVKGFMVNALTAEHALNVLLPFLCAHIGIKPLSKEISGKLNRLRSLRNKVVHDNLTNADVDKKECRELLCAAVFGFEFIKFAEKKLKE